MSTVLCSGLIVLDIVLTVTDLPVGDSKSFATSVTESAGGPAAIGAVAAARLGSSTRLVGRVGADPRGTAALGDLASEGIDLAGVEVASDAGTPVSAIMVDEAGGRMIINHTPPALFTAAPRFDEGLLEGVDAVLVDVRWPDAANKVLRAARERAIPGVLDLDMSPEPGVPDLIALASHVVSSAPALRRLTGVDDLEQALTGLPASVEAAVTDGANGVLVRVGRGTSRIPALDVDVTNTVGAGDVFHGGVVHGLAGGHSFDHALQLGNAASAWACSHGGGRAGAPTAEQLHL